MQALLVLFGDYSRDAARRGRGNRLCMCLMQAQAVQQREKPRGARGWLRMGIAWKDGRMAFPVVRMGSSIVVEWIRLGLRHRIGHGHIFRAGAALIEVEDRLVESREDFGYSAERVSTLAYQRDKLALADLGMGLEPELGLKLNWAAQFPFLALGAWRVALFGLLPCIMA